LRAEGPNQETNSYVGGSPELMERIRLECKEINFFYFAPTPQPASPISPQFACWGGVWGGELNKQSEQTIKRENIKLFGLEQIMGRL
jgi:hypothetical protein